MVWLPGIPGNKVRRGGLCPEKPGSSYCDKAGLRPRSKEGSHRGGRGSWERHVLGQMGMSEKERHSEALDKWQAWAPCVREDSTSRTAMWSRAHLQAQAASCGWEHTPHGSQKTSEGSAQGETLPP